MSARWVAGATRARAVVTRCAGAEELREVASSISLEEALRRLRRTAYRRDLDPAASLAGAQRAVAATLLWHLRVLAGWQPHRGAEALRLFAAGFEIANTEEHLRALSGSRPEHLRPPYRLGSLATAWRRLSQTASPSQLRAALTASAWGDPGGSSPAAVAVGMRISAAARLAAVVPEALRWAAGRAALIAAREMFVVGRRPSQPVAGRAADLLGAGATAADTFADFRDRLPATAHWVVAGIVEPAQLWQAEGRWWERIEADGSALLRGPGVTSAPVVGAVAVLSADAWRMRGALEEAARGGGSTEWSDAPR
ncbi:hypothetical protein [Streptomyces meridianus]|uniref:V-type ATPase subunit n=1 Tax=Streptomyces meridianus TaxID=2938945 RepID=A0ABT0XBJ9_9ACTN|nr:hypothetical protein [Streptomyces meridianus]MCM2579755.1 hypothetical protein [Streptomyces meridianus]